jgi:hypothetical protein
MQRKKRKAELHQYKNKREQQTMQKHQENSNKDPNKPRNKVSQRQETQTKRTTIQATAQMRELLGQSLDPHNKQHRTKVTTRDGRDIQQAEQED